MKTSVMSFPDATVNWLHILLTKGLTSFGSGVKSSEEFKEFGQFLDHLVGAGFKDSLVIFFFSEACFDKGFAVGRVDTRSLECFCFFVRCSLHTWSGLVV